MCVRILNGLSQNRRNGDSPILLRRLRKIGTVPDGFVRSAKLAVGAVAVWWMLVVAAHGQTVTFNFAGAVTELDLNAGLFGPVGAVNVGDPFTGHFSYVLGPGNPDQAPADPVVGRYSGVELAVDGAVISLAPPLVVVRHEFVPAIFPAEPLSIDSLTVFATTAGSQYASGVRLELRGPFGSAFSDDSLPSALNLAAFTEIQRLSGIKAVGIFPAETIDDVGQVSALTFVPEPAGAALAAALLAVALVRERRIRHEGTKKRIVSTCSLKPTVYDL